MQVAEGIVIQDLILSLKTIQSCVGTHNFIVAIRFLRIKEYNIITSFLMRKKIMFMYDFHPTDAPVLKRELVTRAVMSTPNKALCSGHFVY